MVYGQINEIDFISLDLKNRGYELEFSTGKDGGMPSDLYWVRDHDGSTKRRVIRVWCEKNGMRDFQIVRNYFSKTVYELWVKKEMRGKVKYDKVD